MKATLLLRRRSLGSERAAAELVLWQLPTSALGSAHSYKYRLALTASGQCGVQYDNEAGKGDHMHVAGVESAYPVASVEQLIDGF